MPCVNVNYSTKYQNTIYGHVYGRMLNQMRTWTQQTRKSTVARYTLAAHERFLQNA